MLCGKWVIDEEGNFNSPQIEKHLVDDENGKVLNMLMFFSLFSSVACWETSLPGKCHLPFQTMQSELLICLFILFPIPCPGSLKKNQPAIP